MADQNRSIDATSRPETSYVLADPVLAGLAATGTTRPPTS